MRKFLSFALLLLAIGLHAQNIPSPKSHFGFNIGDNYQLANFTQTEAYLKKVAAATKKAKLEVMGKTEEGRNQYMLIVSDSANIAQLPRYKSISQKLARAENLSPSEAQKLADEGKAIVWIDGGLHATETVGIHQWIESIYQILSRNDEETKRILQSTIILFVHANPDGQELVSNWYMRNPDPAKRNFDHLPRLYQKYVGHDNNRDFFMMNMQESKNISRQQYVEWMPQIIYNHHQTGPPGSVVAGPPYRDPFNYVYDPLLVTSIDALGAAMSSRLNAENKPGYTMRAGSVFSTWWNGGLRTTPYFHNMIGILTEIIGSPTPMNIPIVAQRLIPNGATPNPVKPQPWLFKNSIDYSLSLNYAILNYAARYKDELLLNIYKMGRNSIENGKRDNWTLSPKKVEMLTELSKSDNKNSRAEQVQPANYEKVFKNADLRDPRGYIIPTSQGSVAYAFVNILIQSGIRVEQAKSPFTVVGKNYPAGTYVVKTDQAFRPHVLDMFEPQDHPNDFQYPGGPPVRPYDAAGWTPAFTMGLQFDRILEPIEGPFQTVPYGQLQKMTGKLQESTKAKGFTFSTRDNTSFITVNDLLKAGQKVFKNQENFFVGVESRILLEKISKEQGLSFQATAQKPKDMIQIKPMRIGLWDRFGGSMPSGWVRWLFEQYHFDAQVIYAKEIDAGNLNSKFDVILFVDGAIPSLRVESGSNSYETKEPKLDEIPEIYHNMLGAINPERSIPALRSFIENGGRVITIGSSANLAYHFKLPVQNYLVTTVDGKERQLSGDKYYIPGSILQVSLDPKQSYNWGLNTTADIYFSSSPVFKLTEEAKNAKIAPLVWFSTDKPLRSGWAWGQAFLKDGLAAFKADIGKGSLFVYGPEITFRGQTHGTYKMLFNQLYK